MGIGIDWKPVETAPKDGTWILGINNRGNCAVCIWQERVPVVRRIDPVTREWLEVDHVPGWVHPFTDGKLSEFWNGACGSVMVAWSELPRGEDARLVVEKFSRKPE